MTVHPNGTDAKDIALHFLRATGVERATPAIIARTIRTAKSILASGYSKQEILSVIDYIVDVKKIHMYSIGYVSTVINDVLKELSEKEATKKVREEIKQQRLDVGNEVTDDNGSTERNRDKARGLGIQSRFGKKHNFDMFEGHGQTD